MNKLFLLCGLALSVNVNAITLKSEIKQDRQAYQQRFCRHSVNSTESGIASTMCAYFPVTANGKPGVKVVDAGSYQVFMRDDGLKVQPVSVVFEVDNYAIFDYQPGAYKVTLPVELKFDAGSIQKLQYSSEIDDTLLNMGKLIVNNPVGVKPLSESLLNSSVIEFTVPLNSVKGGKEKFKFVY